MMRWLKNAKAYQRGTPEKDAANRATSGCSLCWTCGSTLEMRFPACKICKIPFHPRINEARVQMHISEFEQDITLHGKAIPTVHQYLSGCRATMDSIVLRRGRNEITETQRWDEIKEMMVTHDRLMDLSCYNPDNLPQRLREFLSQGDIEGANGKAVAERGEIHAAYQNMNYNVKIDKRVGGYADNCWFRRFVVKDKYMNSSEANQKKARQRVYHLIAAMWDLSRKKDLLADTLQKAAYPYATENVMPSRLMQVYRDYGHNVQDNATENLFRRKRACVLQMPDAFTQP
jgi:hypothetical protein